MVTHPASLSAHTRALNPTAHPMFSAPASPMELNPRLCVHHHARHHTQTYITPSTHACTAPSHVHTNTTLHQRPDSRTTSNTPRHGHAVHTHNHDALKARQSRVPPHCRRDVACSSIADGVQLKTMCASPGPPPHHQHSGQNCMPNADGGTGEAA